MSPEDDEVCSDLPGFRACRVFFRNSRHFIYRAQRPDGTPVVVKLTAPEAEAETLSTLRHEFETLGGLDLPAVARAREFLRSGDAFGIVLEDAGPHTLQERLAGGPLPLPDALALGAELAAVLASVHEARVIHRDLNPSNVVLDATGRRPTLIDFELATSLVTVASAETSPWRMEGTLPYVSPEQTGRTGRSVDHRTDLYALGATFYEMLTGTPPFVLADPVELVHAHLARQPQPPSDRNPAVPSLVSEITLKLLAKDPGARYQTARGVEQDLRRALEALRTAGEVGPFTLACFDRTEALRIPERLYGREAELNALREALEGLCGAARELLLVVGEPGVGKSAFLSQGFATSLGAGGTIAAGKFDQLQRGVPYAGVAQAFREYLKRLLTAPEAVLASWRARLRSALGPNGGVVAAVVPELVELVGPQPPVPELEALEARNRFNLTFSRFVAALAGPEHPLVLLLDDLQWIDPASLSLLAYLARESELPCLQLVGAYRDAAVGPDHPLAIALNELSRSGVRTRVIHLRPLAPAHLVELLADTLSAEPEEVRSLAGLLHQKTAGNPFFARRLLRSLHEDGRLSFDAKEGRWRWALEAIERAGLAESAVALMLSAIDRLPPASQEMLEAAAATGHRVELGLLASVTGRARAAALRALWPAMEAGLLEPLSGAHRLPRQGGPLDERLEALEATFQFAHDRVQQAAYERLVEPERRVLHLRIGRLMRAGEDGAHPLFDVVDQLNLGAAVMAEASERLDLARLNLQAARSAKTSAAYATTSAYADAGLALLPADAWERHDELSFELHKVGAEAAYLTGDQALAERLIAAALVHAPSPEAGAELYVIRVQAATVRGDYALAVRRGIEGLALVGLTVPEGDLTAATAAATADVLARLGPIEALRDAPELEDPRAKAVMRLLSAIFPAAYLAGSPEMPYLTTQMVALSLRYGHTALSAEAYVQFALALHQGSPQGDAQAAAFGRLAIALARRYAHPAHTCRALATLVSTLNHWYAPLRSGVPLIHEAYQAGLEAGELQWAGYAAVVTVYVVMAVGTPLPEVLREIEKGLSFATKFQNRLVVEVLTAYRQAVRALMGRTIAPGAFDDADFVERDYLAQVGDMPFVLASYDILRLGVAYRFGERHDARRWAQAAAGRLAALPGQVLVADHPYYAALNLAALWSEGGAEERDTWLSELVAYEERLAGWARHAPENYRHRWALVAAERARLAQQPWEALERYNEAIEGAQAEGFVHDEALANELAGRFCLARGQRRLARVYLRASSLAYARWGARAKEEALGREFPDWVELVAGERPQLRETTSGPMALDAVSLLKAAQALSEELVLDRLIEKLLHVAIEAAGATRGVLLLDENGVLLVRAQSAPGQQAGVQLEQMPASEAADLPQAILRYVWRSRQVVELANAALEPLFAGDPVVSRGLRSVLCLPITKQARLIGVLYLENDMLTGAFGPSRVQLLQLLSTQMAISLENAQLIAELKTAAIVVLNSQAVFFRWRIAADFPVEYVSENVERVFGYPAADLLSGAVPFLSIVHPPDRERLLAEFAEALESGRERDTYEYRIVSPDGATRWVESSVRIEREGDLPPRHVEAILTDITERKRAEEERTRLLLREQAARAEVEAAKELDQLKTTFVNAVSHDLRTPLTSIKGYAEFLEDEIGGPLTETQKTFVGQVLKGSQRLEHLVDDLLDFARMEAGSFRLDVEPAELTATIAEILESFRPQTQGARLALEAELPGEPIPLSMDAGRIERVLINLINNAIRFTPEDGRIVVRARLEGDRVRVEVQDTGIGIAEADLPRLFQRFVQIKPGHAKGGAGLGLSISKAIVEAHGGTIGASSRLGEGSVFWFTLPLRPPKRAL